MMPKRAVTYARVSGDDRHNERRNLNGQTQLTREFCAKNGYEIVAELAEDDRGASGAAFELPQLDEARKLAEAGAFDVLVVREIDRLSRNLVKQLLVEAELKDHGVLVEYVLGEYPDTPEGRLNKHIRATIAEYERELITLRTTRARRLKVAAGHVIVNGMPPYGYRQAEVAGRQSLVIVEEEAVVVRRIFQAYVGGQSIRSIQLMLSAERVPTAADLGRRSRKKRGFGEWGPISVLLILRNETYRGVWHYGKRRSNTRGGVRGEMNDRASWQSVAVPGIIDDGLWDRVQERLATAADRSARNLKYEYLLRRRLVCGKCGAKIRAMNNRGWRSYRCPAACSNHTSYAHVCDAPTFGANELEATVWGWLRELLMTPGVLAAGLEAQRARANESTAPQRAELGRVRKRLEEVAGEERRLVPLYLKGKISEQVLDEEAAALRKETARLTARERTLSEELAAGEVDDSAIEDILSWTADIRGQLPESEQVFALRELVVDALNVSAVLNVEDGVKVARARCVLTGKQSARLVMGGSGAAGGDKEGARTRKVALDRSGSDERNTARVVALTARLVVGE